MIGGNLNALIQQTNESTTNSLGEGIPKWEDYLSLLGWLDLSSGDSKYTYNAKIQDSTHVFLCDYVPIDRNTANKRFVANGQTYDILLIDDPMELHEHLEIYLKKLG